MTYAICIDAGGSGCRAVLIEILKDGDGSRILGRGESGAANVASDYRAAFGHILEASQSALQASGREELELEDLDAVLGAAGVNVGNYEERLEHALPFKQSLIISDAICAYYGALEENDGVLAAIGTGSVFISKMGDEIKTLGGWGFQVSDLYSGARIGRSVIEYSLLAYDGFKEQSALSQAILDKFGGEAAKISEFAKTATPQEFGQYAPMLFDFADGGDPSAIKMLKQDIADLEADLNAICQDEETTICMTGSVGRRFSSYFTYAFKKRLVEAIGPPIEGAIYLAEKNFRTNKL